jgi:hypothetical protein
MNLPHMYKPDLEAVEVSMGIVNCCASPEASWPARLGLGAAHRLADRISDKPDHLNLRNK